MNKKLVYIASSIVLSTALFTAYKLYADNNVNSNVNNIVSNIAVLAETTTNIITNITTSTNKSIEILRQEDVQLKLLNAINSIDNIRGSLKVDEKYLGAEYTIDFKVKRGTEDKSYEKYTDKNGISHEITCIGDELTTFYNNNKTFQIDRYSPGSQAGKTKEAKVKERYAKNEKGEKVYTFKPSSIGIGLSRLSLDPQEIAVGFLEDYSNWSFRKGDSYLNCRTIVIDGNFNEYYKEKFKADKFQLTIDRRTGILLKLRKYNSTTNEDSSTMEVIELNFKGKIDDAEFVKSRTGYAELKLWSN